MKNLLPCLFFAVEESSHNLGRNIDNIISTVEEQIIQNIDIGDIATDKVFIVDNLPEGPSLVPVDEPLITPESRYLVGEEETLVDDPLSIPEAEQTEYVDRSIAATDNVVIVDTVPEGPSPVPVDEPIIVPETRYLVGDEEAPRSGELEEGGKTESLGESNGNLEDIAEFVSLLDEIEVDARDSKEVVEESVSLDEEITVEPTESKEDFEESVKSKDEIEVESSDSNEDFDNSLKLEDEIKIEQIDLKEDFVESVVSEDEIIVEPTDLKEDFAESVVLEDEIKVDPTDPKGDLAESVSVEEVNKIESSDTKEDLAESVLVDEEIKIEPSDSKDFSESLSAEEEIKIEPSDVKENLAEAAPSVQEKKDEPKKTSQKIRQKKSVKDSASEIARHASLLERCDRLLEAIVEIAPGHGIVAEISPHVEGAREDFKDGKFEGLDDTTKTVRKTL